MDARRTDEAAVAAVRREEAGRACSGDGQARPREGGRWSTGDGEPLVVAGEARVRGAVGDSHARVCVRERRMGGGWLEVATSK